uniref:Uncharacterized protein n=1 Tax=Arundo donax TaxID=35708 RepID=A0A0A9FGA1_ARUDO
MPDSVPLSFHIPFFLGDIQLNHFTVLIVNSRFLQNCCYSDGQVLFFLSQLSIRSFFWSISTGLNGYIIKFHTIKMLLIYVAVLSPQTSHIISTTFFHYC